MLRTGRGREGKFPTALGPGRLFIFGNSVRKKEHGLKRAQNPKWGPRRQRASAAIHLDTVNVGRKPARGLFMSSMECGGKDGSNRSRKGYSMWGKQLVR